MLIINSQIFNNYFLKCRDPFFEFLLIIRHKSADPTFHVRYLVDHWASDESLSTSSIKDPYNCKFELSTQVLGYTCVIQLLFLTISVHLIDVWFGEDQRTNIIKTHNPWKGLDCTFKTINFSPLNGERDWKNLCIHVKKFNNLALPSSTTKSREV